MTALRPRSCRAWRAGEGTPPRPAGREAAGPGGLWPAVSRSRARGRPMGCPARETCEISDTRLLQLRVTAPRGGSAGSGQRQRWRPGRGPRRSRSQPFRGVRRLAGASGPREARARAGFEAVAAMRAGMRLHGPRPDHRPPTTNAFGLAERGLAPDRPVQASASSAAITPELAAASSPRWSSAQCSPAKCTRPCGAAMARARRRGWPGA